jgi:hypothetical protein
MNSTVNSWDKAVVDSRSTCTIIKSGTRFKGYWASTGVIRSAIKSASMTADGKRTVTFITTDTEGGPGSVTAQTARCSEAQHDLHSPSDLLEAESNPARRVPREQPSDRRRITDGQVNERIVRTHLPARLRERSFEALWGDSAHHPALHPRSVPQPATSTRYPNAPRHRALLDEQGHQQYRGGCYGRGKRQGG